jgi:prophage DNA circulation protein
MATWRERLTGIAKFRGVAFYVSMAERTGGHRGPDHEYPGSNDPPYSEDLGLDGRTFPVEGYVVGLDYLTARDELLNALEEPGSGELIHPTYGTRRVIARKWRVRESKAEGGWAQFSIEFHETSTKPTQPSARTDGSVQVLQSAATAETSVTATFEALYSEAATLRGGAASVIEGAAEAVGEVLDAVHLPAQAAADLRGLILDAQAEAVILAGSAADIVETQVEITLALAEALAESATNPVAEILKLYDFDPGERPRATTAARVIERANYDALKRMTQRLVLIRAATLAIGQSFESYDDAVTARARICDLIDEQAEIVADDTYQALLQLRADLVRAVPGESTALPRIVRHTPAAVLPSLVLAHRLYGDLEAEADLVARNRIRHPGFVPAGEELELLSRE